MSSKSQNLEICIHFLYLVTIYNDSAFYFFEIIVLISLEGTPTQIRMRVLCITFHARGLMMGQCLLYVKILKYLYVYFSSYYLQRLSLLVLWNEYSYYFGGYPDSNTNGAGLHHISWYRAREGSICLPYVKIQNFDAFSTVNYCFGFFSASYFLEMVMPVR